MSLVELLAGEAMKASPARARRVLCTAASRRFEPAWMMLNEALVLARLGQSEVACDTLKDLLGRTTVVVSLNPEEGDRKQEENR